MIEGIPEILKKIPYNLQNQYLNRQKKEKAFEKLERELNKDLTQIFEELWNTFLLTEQNTKKEIVEMIENGILKEEIISKFSKNEDPFLRQLSILCWEPAFKEVQEKNFYTFEEIGERVTEEMVLEELMRNIEKDEIIETSVSGLMKSEYLFLTNRKILLIRKGVLKGVTQFLLRRENTNYEVITFPYESIKKCLVNSNIAFGDISFSVKGFEKPVDFKYPKELIQKMEEKEIEISKKTYISYPPKDTVEEKSDSFTAKKEDPASEVITPSEKKCSVCGMKIDVNAKFCPNCGSKLLENICTVCGSAMAENAKFCIVCGNEVNKITEETQVDSPQPDSPQPDSPQPIEDSEK